MQISPNFSRHYPKIGTANRTDDHEGQITIPAEVRKALNLNAGDKVVFITRESGEVVIIPATLDVNSIKGMTWKPADLVSLDAMDAAIKDRHYE